MIIEITFPKLPEKQWGTVGLVHADRPLIVEADLSYYLGKANWTWEVHKSSRCRVTKTPYAADRQATDAELKNGKIIGSDMVLWMQDPTSRGQKWGQMFRLCNFFNATSGQAISMLGGRTVVGHQALSAYWGVYNQPLYDYAVKGHWRRIPRWQLESDTRLWAGVGIQGAASRVYRAGATLAVVTSVDRPGQVCVFAGLEVGVGATVGQSWGACAVVITNVTDPHGQVTGLVQAGVDWNVAMGQKFLKNEAGAARFVSALKPALKSLGRGLGRATPAVRDIAVALIKNRDSIVSGLKQMFSAAALDIEDRNVMFVGLPGLGGGAEVGVFLKMESFKVLYVGSNPAQMDAAAAAQGG